MKKIFWLAAESSGDLHASGVLRNLQDYDNFGIGGLEMEEAGFRSIFPFERFAVTGLTEVFKHLRFFAEVKKEIVKIFEDNPPDLVVLVDYPGLNLRIAREAKLRGIPVLYFICPKFWAWNYKRIHKLKKYTDMIASILPFEKEHFEKYNVNYEYVGNPIAEEISYEFTKAEFVKKFKLDKNKKLIGFFPGSRNNEISKMLPEFIRAAELLDSKNYEFLISKSEAVSSELFDSFISENNNVKIIKKYNYDQMKHCDFLVITSGTASLEAAIIGTPHIIVYKVNQVSYEVGVRLVKVKWLGLPNLIADRAILPELVQSEATAENIAGNIFEFTSDEQKYNQAKAELNKIKTLLGKHKTSEKTAKIIRKMLDE